MHDLILAKQIVNQSLDIIKNKGLNRVKKVHLEIGKVELSHDNSMEHPDNIDLNNLRFGIKNISRNTVLENTKFIIKKVPGEHWKITSVEV